MGSKKTVKAERGFTLIELMLVVVIIGIMSALAIPLYFRATAKAYRSEALITISKLEIYFKNIYENQGNYAGPYVIANPDVMPDPNNTVALGQGVDWTVVPGHGWDDIPFPPQGDIRMRYLYSVNNSATPVPTVTFTACGSFPGFGAGVYAMGSHGLLCNYLYTEVMQGVYVDANTGVTELPQSF
jgi:prepilin-type N-terminal cleavage/methylation domain-containing protein